VFEGIDGTGKGTLIRLLQSRLVTAALSKIISGRRIVHYKQPGGTELGDKLRELLFTTITTKRMAPNVADLLMLASHLQGTEDIILPALEAGCIVIADRYWYSQYAYAAGRKVSPSVMGTWRELQGPDADVLFILEGDPAAVTKRAHARLGETHQQGKAWGDEDSQIKVAKSYRREFTKYKQTVWVPTDERTPQEIFNESIWPVVLTRLKETCKSYGSFGEWGL